MNKFELIELILGELRRAQTERWVPPRNGHVKRIELPPVLPVDEVGGHISVTQDLLGAVRQYSRIWSDSDASLKVRFTASELADLTGRAFGNVLSAIDLDRPNSELVDDVKNGVDRELATRAGYDRGPVEVILGCNLFRSSQAYPIYVGPVSFETREAWLTKASQQKRLSVVTRRRLARAWSGARIRKRKRSFDEAVERSVLESVGQRPIVCIVETNGLSSKMTSEKGVLAARLAMTGISLLWNHPSEGLSWMNLIYDGSAFHRRYALFAPHCWAGSSSSVSEMSLGRWVDDELLSDLNRYQPIFDILGAAIKSFVQPNAPIERPNLAKSIFLSLWWLQAGCREEADQIATAKFVSSVDALVVGQNAFAIMKFLKARGNYEDDSPLMADGRTTKSVITELYSLRRSQLLHGSSVDFAHDWSSARSTAEAVARLCLVLACAWMDKHPCHDDLKALSQ